MGTLPQETDVKQVASRQETNVVDKMSTVNDNIIYKEINEQELMEKTEAITEHTRLAIVELGNVIHQLKYDNFSLIREQDYLVRFYS